MTKAKSVDYNLKNYSTGSRIIKHSKTMNINRTSMIADDNFSSGIN